MISLDFRGLSKLIQEPPNEFFQFPKPQISNPMRSITAIQSALDHLTNHLKIRSFPILNGHPSLILRSKLFITRPTYPLYLLFGTALPTASCQSILKLTFQSSTVKLTPSKYTHRASLHSQQHRIYFDQQEPTILLRFRRFPGDRERRDSSYTRVLLPASRTLQVLRQCGQSHGDVRAPWNCQIIGTNGEDADYHDGKIVGSSMLRPSRTAKYSFRSFLRLRCTMIWIF